MLDQYSPSDEENKKLKLVASNIIKSLNDECSKLKIDAEAVEVGSVSKDTNLKCSDIDIFILFNKKYDKEFMENTGLKLGHKILQDGIEKYAEHPYVSGHIDNIKVDIVPAYKMNPGERIESTVDRTPLHTKFVNENSNENIRNDIRKLKIFMKQVNVYGSEISKSGFSGYLCEIMVINLGSFINVLKKFAENKGRFLIPDDKSLEKKFPEPVIIIDPVDTTRNAAAAVSLENLARMEIASKLYLETPENLPLGSLNNNNIKDRGTYMKIFTMERPDVIDDIIYPQAVRFKNKLFGIFDKYGYRPVSSEILVNNKIEILIEYEREKPPDMLIHSGPPADSNEVIKFIKIWMNNDRLLRGPYINGNRLYVDIKNENTDFSKIFETELKKIDIGRHLNPLKNKIHVIDVDKNTQYDVLKKFYKKNIFFD